MAAFKCCFCVPIKNGVLAFGVGSFLFFFMLSVASSVLLGLEEENEMTIASMKFKAVFLNALLIPVLVVSVMATLFSVFLIIGIFKHYPGLVLTYFFFGVLITMLMMLGSLLSLIHNYWYLSLTSLLVAALYSYCLTVVFTVHGLMQRGDFNFNLEDQMDDALLIVE